MYVTERVLSHHIYHDFMIQKELYVIFFCPISRKLQKLHHFQKNQDKTNKQRQKRTNWFSMEWTIINEQLASPHTAYHLNINT